MKILMLVPYLPTITMSGGQTRWYNIIKYLAKKYEITLFSLIKDDAELKFIPELKKYCRKVMVFKRPKNPWTLRNILLSVFGPFPLLVIRNQSFEERLAIRRELARERYDVIHAETFYVMPHLGKTETPTVLVEQTIWHDVYLHYVRNEVPLLLRPFYLWDVAKIIFWERYFWGKADKLFSVSGEDRHEMKKVVPGKEVGIIPNGVDVNYFSQVKFVKKTPPRVLYGVTNFEWLQNQEATEILIKKVWPEIVKKDKTAILWIVGRKIPTWIKERATSDPRVEVTENIKDAREAYLSASVMVAPIRGSGGTRLKILEAMASGLPVVSTKNGLAGLKVSDGVNVFIADSPKDLAEKTLKVLKNIKAAQKVGLAGREHVKGYFDWTSIVKLHDPIYNNLVKSV